MYVDYQPPAIVIECDILSHFGPYQEPGNSGIAYQTSLIVIIVWLK